MRCLLAAGLAFALASCGGPASRLTLAERAHIYCQITGNSTPMSCTGSVTRVWTDFAAACSQRSGVLQLCSAEFKRRYGCNVSKSEEKITDDKGNVTTRTVETKSGPGCDMSTSQFESLERIHIADCMGSRYVPDTSPRENAFCDCGTSSCWTRLPHVTDDMAVYFFPDKK